MRLFYEIVVYLLLTIKAPITASRLVEMFLKAYLTNSVDPDQTAPASCPIWGPHCSPLYILTFTNMQAFVLTL